MSEQNEELNEKYSLFQKDILSEHNFLRKIKDIFNLQNEEKFQDILILQKSRFLEQIEKEVLLILKNIYSEKIVNNKRFNSLFKTGKEWIESKYNCYYQEIISEWEKFNNLKKGNKFDDEGKLNSYYITDFRKHCQNHGGVAIHKCGHAEKGKFIKIIANPNSRFKYKKELKYVICEECKKVFYKDFFINYCTYCKENYLCSILNENENKELFLATYSSPHCDSLINKTIPCKLCREKLYLFINDKKLKCLKCSYIIDLNNKNEFQWQCTKCNNYFKSNVKIYNSTENLIVQKIISKALLLKIKASPKLMTCCDIDIKTAKFFHKNDCKGTIYSCNIENYLLKNKKNVIVCEKCHAILSYKNFNWICPKCGKRVKESNQENEENIPQKKENEFQYNINTVGDENTVVEKSLKSSFFQKYSASFTSKSPLLSSFVTDDNNQNKKNRYDSSKNNNKDKNELDLNKNEEVERIRVNKCNEKFFNNNSKRNYFFRSKRYNNNRNSENNIKVEKNDVSSSIVSLDKFKNSREKYKNRKNLNSKEECQNNDDDNKNNNDKKKVENTIPFPRRNNIKNRYLLIPSKLKEEEKVKEDPVDNNRGDSCKSGNIYINNIKEEKNNDNKNIGYLNKNNFEENKRNLFLNLKNRKNIPVRLRYVNDKKDNNKQSLKKSLELDESNNKILKEYEKEGENLNNKSKRFLLYSVEKISQNEDGIMSKETTAHGSKGSAISYSKESSINNIKKLDNSNISNDTSKDKDNLHLGVSNFYFRNKRKHYMKEKEKEKLNNIQNINNNIQNKDISKRLINPKKDLKLNDIESNSNNDQYNISNEQNKPDGIIEPNNINYSEDIEIYDNKIKQNKELYNTIQKGIKGLLEKSALPLFNIDDYIIGKKIGDGAFGVLFSVTNKKTRKNYALKKLTATDLKSLEEFLKEFKIAYKSNHQNILNIFGICIRVYDSTTFSLFVLMALGECDWEIEINKRFKEKNYYSEKELIKILKQLSSALVYLQNNQIAHRDIKPENIILFHENGGVVYKICDFGEAKEKIKVNSRHKSIRGTDFYMSPILFKGLTQEEKFVRDNAYKSDVFSLGYCMIIACVLDFNFINKIRNIEEQTKVDKIIRESLENRYSYNFIRILLKMIVYSEKDRIDFLGLEKLINDEL